MSQQLVISGTPQVGETLTTNAPSGANVGWCYDGTGSSWCQLVATGHTFKIPAAAANVKGIRAIAWGKTLSNPLGISELLPIQVVIPPVTTPPDSGGVTLSVANNVITWTPNSTATQGAISTAPRGDSSRTTTYQVLNNVTSWTPPVADGVTLYYGVLTGGTWSDNEVSIAWASQGGSGGGTGGGTPTNTLVGMNGSAGWAAATDAGIAAISPKIVRGDYNKSPSGMAAMATDLHAKGIQVIANFSDYTTSSSTIVSWAKANLKAGDVVELGNEDGFPYKNPTASTAQAYARQCSAVFAGLVGTGIKTIAQADQGGGTSTMWVDNLYVGVPNFHQHVDGWVIHPYGVPNSGDAYYDPIHRLTTQKAQVASHGAPDMPWYATEYGIASDNGTAVVAQDKGASYGWPLTLTYDQMSTNLADALRSIATAHPDVYCVCIYQGVDQKPHGTNQGQDDHFGMVTVQYAAPPYQNDLEPVSAKTGVITKIGGMNGVVS